MLFLSISIRNEKGLRPLGRKPHKNTFRVTTWYAVQKNPPAISPAALPPADIRFLRIHVFRNVKEYVIPTKAPKILPSPPVQSAAKK